MRASMMVMLGCDVYEPGMKQIGATKLKAELQSVKEKLLANSDALDDEQFYHGVMKHVANFTGLGVEVVDTLVRGIIFEPTNAVSAKQMTLELMLERFLTGTERTKSWGVCRVSAPSAQGPITELSLVSSSKEAKDLKDKNKIERHDVDVGSDSSDNNRELFSELDASPEYLRAKLLMEAAGVSIRESTKVGFQLLQSRANKEMQSITCDEVLSIQQQAREGWSKLQHECNQRSFRVANHSMRNLRQHTTLKSSRKRSATKSTSTTQSKRQQLNPPVKRQGRALPTKTTPSPKKKKTKSKHHSHCARLGCNVTNVSHPNTKFHRIPAEPKPLPPNAKRSRYISWAGRVLLRKEVLDRCHFKRNVKGGNYRCCEEHEFEFAIRSVQLCWNGKSSLNHTIFMCLKAKAANLLHVKRLIIQKALPMIDE
jgi:hypothetical protein